MTGGQLSMIEEGSIDPWPADCTVCGRPSLRTGFDGQPMHTTCEPSASGVLDRPTSIAAGKAVRRGLRSPLGQSILEHLRQVRDATDDELAIRFPDEHPGSISKRRGDLVALGLVIDTGRTRPTRRGRDAVVWRAVDPGPE